MVHLPPRALSAILVVACLGLLLLGLLTAEARAQTAGGLEASLDLVYLLAVQPLFPLLPLLAGAGLFKLTRSHLIAVIVPALIFGAWAVFFFSRTSLNGPLAGALYGLKIDGVLSALFALAGSGYAHLVIAEARRLGTTRTAIVHTAGIAFAIAAFTVLLVTRGSDTVGIGLYAVMIALSLGLSAATGSFGGVVATLAFALVAMVQGVWGAALASGAHDAGQAYIAILYVLPLLVPVIVAAAIGRWLGGILRTRGSPDRPA